MKTYPKIILFLVFHIGIFLPLWLTRPVFDTSIDSWWYGTNWFKYMCNTAGPALFFALLVGSVLSCFSNKKLTATQIGQWTAFNWMPKWGCNQHNSWYGLFLGLPSPLVIIKTYDVAAKTEKKVAQIQIEKHGDPARGKFPGEFDFNYKWRICDTYIYELNPCTEVDRQNLIIRILTEWLNSPTHNYSDILQLKADKSAMQIWLEESVIEAIRSYGIEITEPKLVDIEEPKDQIEQRIKDAAAKRAQEEQDVREGLDTEAHMRQVDLIIERSKDMSGNPTLTWKEANDVALKLRGIVKETRITTGGGKKGNKSPVVPVVHTP